MRRYVIIRHAIAEDREEFARSGQPDEERPLSPRGRSRMKDGARGLTIVVDKLAVVVTSPLVRARQTADIVAKAFGGVPIVETEHLSPGAPPERLAEWLRTRPEHEAIALVGHEPGVSGWISWAAYGQADAAVEMKKGAACRIEFEFDPEPGTGVLRWLLPPSALRRLGSNR